MANNKGKYIYDDQKIEQFCKDWVFNKISKNFKFREYQLECIVKVIQNILNHKYQNYIIEAPTGSGKSLINMIAAGVLAEYFNITSYILVSDLFLWEQYEKFIKKYPHTGIASIKGQTGNYTCKINKEDIRNADCRMSGLSWASLFSSVNCKNLGYPCALNCEYVKARKKATKAKVCVMTYQLFLFIMNNSTFNTDQQGKPIFAPHDVLFCDEAHNIPEIIQLQYSPTIRIDDFNKLKMIYDHFQNSELSLFDDNLNNKIYKIYKQYPSWDSLYTQLYKFWKIWTCVESRKDEDIKSSNEYLSILNSLSPIINDIKNYIITKKNNYEPLTKEDISLFKLNTWYENHMCRWDDMCQAIKQTGYEYFLKDINIPENRKSYITKDEDIFVEFKCTKEDYITWYFLLRKAQHKVMVSATIGTKEAFDERMGFNYEEKSIWDHPNSIVNESFMETLPSSFDFSQSPVYFFNKFKMTFRERENSFRYLKQVIYSICKTKFKDQKGMIQTGSYEFAKRLYNDAPEEIKYRMLLYNGSREKFTTVKLHQMSENTILVGPTLNTGIDLPGDNCRFIIILKVPYPTLMDKLTNERNKLYPKWYMSHTSNEIIQGIGRGVRFNGDWCVTYILDASFNQLYYSTKDQYPQELQDRIKYI